MPVSGYRWLAAVSVLVLCGCAGESAPAPAADPVEVAGQCADAYQGQVCAEAKVQGDAVLDIGAVIPLASIENAPPEVVMAWPPPTLVAVDLPEAARQQTGFTHMTMNWEMGGHPPAVYMTPHFDFHFYRIPQDQRLAIDCSDVSKPSSLPEGYSLPDEALPPEVAAMIGVSTLVGVCVPEMGMHSLPAADVASDQVFRATMVVGYYAGEVIFVEPMITREMLLERQSFDLPIPAIPGQEGMPTRFSAVYDAATDAYHFVLTGMGSGMGAGASQ